MFCILLGKVVALDRWFDNKLPSRRVSQLSNTLPANLIQIFYNLKTSNH